MPWMWSSSPRADRNRVSDGNAQRGHDNRICDVLEQGLNLSLVRFFIEPMLLPCSELQQLPRLEAERFRD